MITFSHSGSAGDLLYSLTFCREYLQKIGEEKCNFRILLPEQAYGHYTHNHQRNAEIWRTIAANMVTLLESQPYINQVSLTEKNHESADLFDLDRFRKLKLNFSSGNIKDWFYYLTPEILPRNFAAPAIFAEKKIANIDIVLFRSLRYRNPYIDYRFLERYRERITFVGTEQEHRNFEQENFSCRFYPTTNFLELAEVLNSCKLAIGNQSGIFALAEQMKIPRILESSQYHTQSRKFMFVSLRVIFDSETDNKLRKKLQRFFAPDHIIPGPANVIPEGGSVCASACEQEFFEQIIAAALEEK